MSAARMSWIPPTRDSTSAPKPCRSRPRVWMSRTSGMLRRRTVSSVSREAHISGREAFFAPETRTVPSRGRPPTMRILSMELSVYRRLVTLRERGGGSLADRWAPDDDDPGNRLQVGHDLDLLQAAGLEDPENLLGLIMAHLDGDEATRPQSLYGERTEPAIHEERFAWGEQSKGG